MILMKDLYLPVSVDPDDSVDDGFSCFGCAFFYGDSDYPFSTDCDLCSRNYDTPCDGLQICEE